MIRIRYLALALTLSCSNAYANNINATSNPVANSSGSVTNFAVQNLTGRMPTQQFGGGIVCQGGVLSIQPFLSSNVSFTRPHELYYMEPQYSTLDVKGAFDDDGNDIGDGEVDEPGKILFMKPVRTGQKENFAISPGISLSWNIPLDRKARRLCLKSAEAQANIWEASLQDKRLSYELGRMKICAEQMKLGVRFKANSRFYNLCEDVELVNAPGVLPNHRHPISLEKSKGE